MRKAKTYSTCEAGDLAGISRHAVKRMIYSGVISPKLSLSDGGKYVLTGDDIKAIKAEIKSRKKR